MKNILLSMDWDYISIFKDKKKLIAEGKNMLGREEFPKRFELFNRLYPFDRNS